MSDEKHPIFVSDVDILSQMFYIKDQAEKIIPDKIKLYKFSEFNTERTVLLKHPKSLAYSECKKISV